MELEKIIDNLLPIVEHAGNIELKYFHDDFEVMGKGDGSPVTWADRDAETYIKRQLSGLYSDIPFVGEEAVEAGYIPDISKGTFWLVDALDGTKQFIKKSDEFSVNIALMVDFKPVLGVIYAPIKGEFFYGCNGKSFKREGLEGSPMPIEAREIPESGWVIFDSRSHSNQEKIAQFLDISKIKETVKCGASLKFCVIAEGKADMYPRFWPTSEWDIAAGHAILKSAGGDILTPEGEEMIYGKVEKKFENPYFIAYGNRKNFAL